MGFFVTEEWREISSRFFCSNSLFFAISYLYFSNCAITAFAFSEIYYVF